MVLKNHISQKIRCYWAWHRTSLINIGKSRRADVVSQTLDLLILCTRYASIWAMSNTVPSRADPVVVFPLGRWCPPQETSQPHPHYNQFSIEFVLRWYKLFMKWAPDWLFTWRIMAYIMGFIQYKMDTIYLFNLFIYYYHHYHHHHHHHYYYYYYYYYYH